MTSGMNFFYSYSTLSCSIQVGSQMPVVCHVLLCIYC